MKTKKNKRVAIYARVSTEDRDQDPETQLMPLREHAERRGFEVVDEYVDHESGRKADREDYQRLFEDVRRRTVDVVLVWRYDRFARSVHELINALEEFRSLGVDFISYQEQIDTTTPQGKFFFTVVAGFAELESALISQRVKAGMARAKRQGKQIGRSKIPKAKRDQIAEMARQGSSIRKISKELGIAYDTAWRYVKKKLEP